MMEENQKGKFDVVETWLNTVSYSHSQSQSTSLRYRDSLKKFEEYAGKTAQQFYLEYQSPNTNDNKFKMFYAQLLKGLIGAMQKRKYSASSVATTVNAVKSFFKYSDLPLGFVPSANGLVEFHNKEIEREDVLEILNTSNPREKAFYTLMAQSGLRPSSICALRVEDVEGILDEKTPVPCLITVKKESTKGKFSEYFTFCGEDSVATLKDYLKTRSKILLPEAFLFTMVGKDDEKPLGPGVESHLFDRTAKKLREKGILHYETSSKDLKQEVKSKRGSYTRNVLRRSEFRLYNLRKFFRKYAASAGVEYVNFWMGHLSALGVDLHYFSRDVEQHRQIYKEKAMPNLRLQTQTPSETEKKIEDLLRENVELRAKVANIEASKAEFETVFSRVKELEARENARLEAERKLEADNDETLLRMLVADPRWAKKFAQWNPQKLWLVQKANEERKKKAKAET